ncbi:hypothetical protein PMAYCL1PPCAC_27423, partial [Pristionchus mayeri]
SRVGGMFTLLLLLFLPAAEATCPTTLPTDATFGTAGQYHGGEYGSVSSVHLLSFENPAPSTYSLAYTLASGSFMKSPSDQCPASCLKRLRAMAKPGKEENSDSIIMMWDDASASPPDTNILYAAYTTTVVPGEYLYCSSVPGTCGANTPLYLYYNSETDDYQVRGDKDTVDDKGTRLQNMGLPICWTFPALPTTTKTSVQNPTTSTTPNFWPSTTTTRSQNRPSTVPVIGGGIDKTSTTTSPSEMVRGSSTTTTYSGVDSDLLSTSTTSNGRTETTTGTTTTAYKGPSTTTNPYASTLTTTTIREKTATGSSTTTTAYTGPSTTVNPSASSTTAFTGSGASSTITSSVSKMTTTSPFVYNATTDAAGTYGPGDQKLENGTVIRPNGDTIYPNGTVKTGDGTVIEGGKKIDSDGTIHNPDGSTKYPNGTVIYPKDSSSTEGGSGNSDDDTPSWVIPVIIVTTILIGVAALGMIVFGVTSMMKSSSRSAINPYERQNAKDQWPDQRHPRPSSSADLPPPVYEPVTTAQPQSFGATQSLAGAPIPLYFG